MIGPNGAGKSTLFNAIVGVVKMNEGQVIFDGENITGFKPFEVARVGIARTFQNLKLFHDMTVIDNIMVGGLCGTKTRFWGALLNQGNIRVEDKKIQTKAESILESLELSELKNKPVGELPFGQKKAIELARALATDPKIILLDEPKAGMNIEEAEAIMNILRKIKSSGLTIFLIEHDMRLIMDISDRISVLDFGIKIAEGTPREIQNNEKVVKAYLGQ